MLDRFKDMDPGRNIVTVGGPVQVFIAEKARHITSELANDPIFSVGGDLALNWAYANNGNRIVLTMGNLSLPDSDDENTHGLGNNYLIDPKTAQTTNAAEL